ncbi:MAG: 2'-deoxycytidine 5'-triphosphate deaminase [Candidatus Yonathbacteria bacterium]|nr:2'-deoxycytidine 5'-triphosphate deaminase [Candidatus Yonathbacteria bacterium]
MFLHCDRLKSITFGGGGEQIIRSSTPIENNQIQPASFDARLGYKVYRMKSAALPGPKETVQHLIEEYCMYDFGLAEHKGQILEVGACYIIPLREGLVPSRVYSAVFSPKSSIGRCDVFVRVLTDCTPGYDRTAVGYDGNFYLEIIPLSFNVMVYSGMSMTQFRIQDQYHDQLSTSQIRFQHELCIRDKKTGGILFGKNKIPISLEELPVANNRLYFHLDLNRKIVGFEAKRSPTEVLDLGKKDYHHIDDFWQPIKKPNDGALVLTPGHFYLLSTLEGVKIPHALCAEVVPYEISSGEFRTHYAGFFDNGFGGETGTKAVLEVRVRDTPFRVLHGQPICSMEFFRTEGVPSVLYGNGAGSSYIGSGPSLSKHFKDREIAWKE